MINYVRHDALMPDLSGSFDLESRLVEEFQKNGHVCVRGLCSPEEVAAYREVIVEVANANNTETRPLEERDTYGKAFLQTMNLWTLDERVKGFVLARRFADVAAKLLGVNKVRLYHDQALFKEPGGGVTPWHQDQFYWPLATDQAITLWMPLVDVDQVMGTMTFADGSHEQGFVPISQQISEASETFFDRYVSAKGFNLTSAGAMKAGDATFHTGWTLHKAPGNVTDRVRAVMTIIYYPDGTTISTPKNDFQKADLASWLNGLEPGALADGPLNPILN
ncbi:MAG: phytanoyl-CoA dioxygenase family protein [Armatimonadetes bacterium]|nr:phytanoyl-CoA dioxygenase family protein [Armatimonadota bacterium]